MSLSVYYAKAHDTWTWPTPEYIEYWVSIKGYVLSFCIGFLFRQISSPAHDPKQFVFICSDRMCREIKETNIDLFYLMTIAAVF